MECKICKEKDETKFYSSNKSCCKECVKERVKNRRLEKIDEIREYDRNRPNAKERTKKNAERIAFYKENDIEKYNNYSKSKNEWAKRNRHKRNAHLKVQRAIMKGILIRPFSCECCKKDGKIEAHHDDYNKPLEVMWLCVDCHNERHKNLGTKRLLI